MHAWLDQDTSDPNVAYKLIEGDTMTYNNVPAGDHTLTVQLVENNHQPVQPEIKQVIHFKTSGGSGAGISGENAMNHSNGGGMDHGSTDMGDSKDDHSMTDGFARFARHRSRPAVVRRIWPGSYPYWGVL